MMPIYVPFTTSFLSAMLTFLAAWFWWNKNAKVAAAALVAKAAEQQATNETERKVREKVQEKDWEASTQVQAAQNESIRRLTEVVAGMQAHEPRLNRHDTQLDQLNVRLNDTDKEILALNRRHAA